MIERFIAEPGFVAASLVLAGGCLSALCTGLLVRHGRMLDGVGRHRLHASPTPRGGGMAIAVAVCTALLGLALGSRVPLLSQPMLAWLCGLLLVTLIGLWDDLRGASIRVRLLAQMAAASLCTLAFAAAGDAGGLHPLVWLAVVGALIWSINLHNFMDGLNGHLVAQALWVFAWVTAVAWARGHLSIAAAAGVSVAALIGFAPYNFPRARIFLGDAGSGFLGLWLGVCLLWAWQEGLLGIPVASVLVSAFVIDATMTLGLRFFGRRRWYDRHTEHLYQWLARLGWRHPRVVAAYVAWNLGVALPATMVMARLGNLGQALLACAVYGLGLCLWLFAKHRVLMVFKLRRIKYVVAQNPRLG